MAYTALLVGGPASGQELQIEKLVRKIEIPIAGDLYSHHAIIGLFTYERQPTISPVKDGDVVIYKPEQIIHDRF